MRRLGVLALVLTALTACGASINAVYEGDVRFEHCMALDAEVEVKPPIRKACWEEWTKFYTYGQTRDRVEYAKHRVRQLNKLQGDDDDVELLVGRPRSPSAVPEPTSALAPPPMMLVTDAGAGGGEDAGADAADIVPIALPAAACSSACEKTFTECRTTCVAATCEPGCGTKYKRCMRKCF